MYQILSIICSHCKQSRANFFNLKLARRCNVALVSFDCSLVRSAEEFPIVCFEGVGTIRIGIDPQLAEFVRHKLGSLQLSPPRLTLPIYLPVKACTVTVCEVKASASAVRNSSKASVANL